MPISVNKIKTKKWISLMSPSIGPSSPSVLLLAGSAIGWRSVIDPQAGDGGAPLAYLFGRVDPPC